jgi:hypothetical protein
VSISNDQAYGENVSRLVQPNDRDQRLERTPHQAVESLSHGTGELGPGMLHSDQREQRGLRRREQRAEREQSYYQNQEQTLFT